MKKNLYIISSLLCLCIIFSGCSQTIITVNTTEADSEITEEINTEERETEESTTEESTAEESTAEEIEKSIWDSGVYIDSKKEAVKNYSWQDLYIIMILATRTTSNAGANIPSFSVVSIPGVDYPFLIAGWEYPDGSGGDYSVYAVDSEYVYLLLEYSGNLYWDSSAQAFYCDADESYYGYVPHTFVSVKAENQDLNLTALTNYKLGSDLRAVQVNSDNISDFIQEVE